MATVDSTVEYRDIPGFIGYRVGDDGSVWSCRGYRGIITSEWHQLRPYRGTTGHLRVNLSSLGIQLVHRLVLLAFVGPCPEGMECCHEDGDPSNNKPSNLRWDTRKANYADRVRHGTHNRGERHGNAKLTAAIVLGLRARHAELKGSRKIAPPDTIPTLAREFNVYAPSIKDVIRRVSWKHI